MIEISNLSKNFSNKRVFENASIRIDDASICGLVGINGAGKSTLLRILSGVLKPDSGSVLIGGEPVYENERVKRKLFFLPDDPYYDANFTGEKLRGLYKTFYAFDDEIFNYYIKTFSLDLKKPVRNFSKGMKRQIFIAAALACKPEYLFLDEAFDGLDPLARLEFKRGIIGLQESGSTVIIASHSLRELEDICDSFVLLDGAGVKLSGSVENTLENTVKLQLAFAKAVTRNDFPFECLQYGESGRIITIVARGDKQEIMQKISAMNPIIVQEIPMDLEDLFIEEVCGGGQE